MNDKIIPINVETIMEEIKENIREKGYRDIPLSFEEMKKSFYGNRKTFNKKEFENLVFTIRKSWNVQTDHIIDRNKKIYR